MAHRNPGTLDWVNSESKQIVLDDLESGIISMDKTETAKDLYYSMYQFTPKFIAEKVLFEQFEKHLKDHRKQLKYKHESPAWEMAALAHDQNIFPKNNAKGKEVFLQ